MIDIFFALLNFSIFCGVIIYVFRRSFLPQLREKIMNEYHTLVRLHDDHRQLITAQRNLEGSIAYQEDYAKVLFKKINHWRNVVDLQKEAQANLAINLLKDADAKVARQAQKYALGQAYKTVAPRVVQQLQKDLEKRYKDPNEAHRYIDNLLKVLK